MKISKLQQIWANALPIGFITNSKNDEYEINLNPNIGQLRIGSIIIFGNTNIPTDARQVGRITSINWTAQTAAAEFCGCWYSNYKSDRGFTVNNLFVPLSSFEKLQNSEIKENQETYLEILRNGFYDTMPDGSQIYWLKSPDLRAYKNSHRIPVVIKGISGEEILRQLRENPPANIIFLSE